MMNVRSLLVAAVMLTTALPVQATISDPAGDFLPSFTGAPLGEVDVVGAAVVRRATGWDFSVTANGPVGVTPGVLYVWGINRGAGTPRLSFGSPSIGGGVNFDAVFVMFNNGDARVAAFPAAGPPAITNLPGALSLSGNSISGFAPLALLPSRGFAPEDYTFSLWTRLRANPLVDGTNVEIADLLGAGGFSASVPEPQSWALLLAGFAGVGMMARRQRRRLA